MVNYLNMKDLKKEIIRDGKKLKLVKKYDRYARYEDEKGNQQCFTYNDLGVNTYQLSIYERSSKGRRY